MPSSRADYYRLQARLCVRLSLASSQDSDISERLIAMAQRFKARAEAIEREHHLHDSGPDLVHQGCGAAGDKKMRPTGAPCSSRL